MPENDGTPSKRDQFRRLEAEALRMPPSMDEWIVEDGRRSPTPHPCDLHHAEVHSRLWRTGEPLTKYPVLTDIERQLDFGDIERQLDFGDIGPHCLTFLDAWNSSAEEDSRCWLSDELAGTWLEAVGDHHLSTASHEWRAP